MSSSIVLELSGLCQGVHRIATALERIAPSEPNPEALKAAEMKGREDAFRLASLELKYEIARSACSKYTLEALAKKLGEME